MKNLNLFSPFVMSIFRVLTNIAGWRVLLVAAFVVGGSFGTGATAVAGSDAPFPMSVRMGDVIYQDGDLILVVDQVPSDVFFYPVVHVAAIDRASGEVLYYARCSLRLNRCRRTI